MSSLSRGLCVWDSGSVFGEAIFYFRFPVRSGLHTRYKPQLEPASFHGLLPILPGQTLLPCRLSVGGGCHSNQEPPSASYTGCCSVAWREHAWCAPHLLWVLPFFWLSFLILGSSGSIHFSSLPFWGAAPQAEPLQIDFAAVLQFALVQRPLDFLDMSGHFPYYQWSCTFPIPTFLIFSVISMRILDNVNGWWGMLLSLSYSEFTWCTYSSIHLSMHPSMHPFIHLVNGPEGSNFDKFESSLIMLLFPSDSSHLVPSFFSPMGTWLHSSKHVFTCLSIICIIFLYHWPDERN